MLASTGCFDGFHSRFWPRRAGPPPSSAASAMRDTTKISRGPNLEDLNRASAVNAIHKNEVARNTLRIDCMREYYEHVLREGTPIDDAEFDKQVSRPLMTWLRSLTYLPDEGDYLSVAQCAQALLAHIPAPDSHERRPLREFGSTDRLDARDGITVARSFVATTIPLLHRFVELLRSLADHTPCGHEFARLLNDILGHADAPLRAVEVAAPIYATVGPRSRREGIDTSERRVSVGREALLARDDESPPLPERLVSEYGVLLRNMPPERPSSESMEGDIAIASAYAEPFDAIDFGGGVHEAYAIPQYADPIDVINVIGVAADVGEAYATPQYVDPIDLDDVRVRVTGGGAARANNPWIRMAGFFTCAEATWSRISADSDAPDPEIDRMLTANGVGCVDEANEDRSSGFEHDVLGMTRGTWNGRPSTLTVRAEVHAPPRFVSSIATCPTASGRPPTVDVHLAPWDSRTRKPVVIASSRPPSPEIDYDFDHDPDSLVESLR